MTIGAHEHSHRASNFYVRDFVTKHFRSVTVGGLLLIVFLGGYVMKQRYDTHREFEASQHRIAFGEVQIEDFALKGTEAAGYRVTGRVRNRSPRYTLTGMQLQVVIKDCYQSTCDVVGQADVPVSGMEIPPAQLRWLDRQVYFSSLPPMRGSLQWSYKVDYITAR